MANQSQSSSLSFFSESGALFSRSLPAELTQDFRQSLDKLLGPYTEPNLFQQDSLNFVKKFGEDNLAFHWEAFIKKVKKFSEKKTEQLNLLKLGFQCFANPLKAQDLGLLVDLVSGLKAKDGDYLLTLFFKAKLSSKERVLKNHVGALQYLLDLCEEESLDELLKEELLSSKKEASLVSLLDKLKLFNAEYLIKRYPEKDIDTLMACFSQKSELVEFPLEMEELLRHKEDCVAIKASLSDLHALPQRVLQEKLKASAAVWNKEKSLEAKREMLAIIVESIRRQYGILPYNTQILTALAFLDSPEHLKGRIGQIRTGEGKSTLTAMLAAFLAAQGEYVDIVTSSENLAERDCEEFSSFFSSLGFSSSHIQRNQIDERDFYGQIVFGTHSDYEFAFLRDGLNRKKQRRTLSIDERYGPVGSIIPRPYQWCLIDEVDSLLLDSALSAAQIGQTNPRNLLWLYKPLFYFVKERGEKIDLTPALMDELRFHLETHLEKNYPPENRTKYKKQLAKFSSAMLKRWCESAHTALYKKDLEEDYLIKPRKKIIGGEEKEVLDIVIIDVDTGRLREGTQWQNGIHQFAQLKHDLDLSLPLRTIASVSQPGYFSLYTKEKYCLTGTIGEPEERKGFEDIYNLGSFSVPTHRDCIRTRLKDEIFLTREEKWERIYKSLEENRKKGLPSLVLFKHINESNAFSRFLAAKGVKHNLLNETQRVSETYVLRQAGECGGITIATNTAGRGTDIKLSNQAKEKGGLQMLFGFYPANLRVELQGFGRAGRQGQAGSCRMFLDLEDKYVRTLLKLEGEKSKELDRALLEKLGSAGLLEELKHQRSLHIQKECEKRAENCEREKMYFSKLCDYFKCLDKVYEVTEGDFFAEKIMALCSQGEDINDLHSKESLSLKLKTSLWLDLQRAGLNLRQQRELGKTLDWEPFIQRFKETYLNHISNLWAVYYSRLKDPLVEESEKEKAYAKLKPYLDQPMEMAEKALSFLLGVRLAVSEEDREELKISTP